MKKYEFIAAKAVWEAGTEKTMNRRLVFRAEIEKSDGALLALTGSSAYTVRVNGDFVAFGPARSAHGFFRVDELDLSKYLNNSINIVTVDVAGYNVCSFYHLDQPSFLTAEIVSDGKVVAATGVGGFICRVLSEHEERVHRYSYQRTFCEVYNLDADCDRFFKDSDVSDMKTVALEEVGEKTYIERGCEYTEYPLRAAKKVVRRGKFTFGAHGQEMNLNRQITLPRKYYPVSGKCYGGYKLSELTTCSAVYTRNMDNAEIHDVNEVAENFTVKSGEFAIIEFDVNTTGAFEFDVSCGKDATVLVTFDEMLFDGDVNFRRMGAYASVIYRLKAGKYTLGTFEPYTCKYVKIYAVASDIKIGKFGSRFFGANGTDRQCVGDGELKEIFNAAVETYRQNTFTAFLDCPSRERGGWLCDSYFTARVEKILTGKSDVEHDFLENFLLPDKFDGLPDGILPMCYPGDHYNGSYIPNWDMFYVLELEEYYGRTGDAELIALAKPKIYKMLEYLGKFENEYGLLENLEQWVFVDWSKSNELTQDVNFPTNMLYAMTLECAARMFDDETLKAKAARIHKTVNDMAYVGPFYCDNAVRKDGKLVLSGEFTESCQNYAFFCGTATPDTRPELFRILMDDFGPDREKTGKWKEVYPANMFIGNYIRLEMMSRFGENEKLLHNIRGYFLEMARTTGTLWEKVNIYGSLCHGFASHVIYWLDKLGYVK